MPKVWFTFYTRQEAAQIDFGKFGTITHRSPGPGGHVAVELDLTQWRRTGDDFNAPDTLAAIRAALAACGHWPGVSQGAPQ